MRWPGTLFANPIVILEIRTRLRHRRSLVAITLYLAVVALIAVVFLLKHRNPTADQGPQTGAHLFAALAIGQLCLLLFITPASMAGAVSGERRRLTWDLLTVTELTSFDIVWGKLLVGVAVNVLLLLVPLPIFAAVFLFGGVTPEDVAHTYVVLLGATLLLAAVTLFVSSLSRRPLVILFVSNLISMVLGFGLSLLVLYLELGTQDSGLPILGELGNLPPGLPALPPFALMDPLIALVSALPNGSGNTLLGTIGDTRVLLLPARLPLWGGFVLVALVLTILLLTLSTLLIRSGISRPGRERW